MNLSIFILSWNRPHYLKPTIESLLKNTDGDVYCIDNGSNQETIDVINSYKLKEKFLLKENLGINPAFELCIPKNLKSKYIMFSGHDMYFTENLNLYCDFLDNNPTFGATCAHDSPEHLSSNSIEYGKIWKIKDSERGDSLMLRTDHFQELRPLKGRNFDWFIVKYLRKKGLPISVYHTAHHLGWHLNDSTWAPQRETPEFINYNIT